MRIRLDKNMMLTVASSVGVIATGVAGAWGMKRAIDSINEENPEGKLETAIVAAPSFIPAAISAGISIYCIITNHIVNKETQAMLLGSVALAKESFNKYRKVVIDTIGEEAEQEMRMEVVRQQSDYHIQNINTPDKKLLFYEPLTSTYIERYEREIIDAEYHLNRNFALSGYVTVRDFCNILGIDIHQSFMTDKLLDKAWSIEEGYCWIDFEHRLVDNGDGEIFYIIDPIFEPLDEYEY